MERKSLVHRVLSSFLDTLHYWSGAMLEQERERPAKSATPATDLPSAPATTHLVRQPMVALTTFMAPGMAEEISQLAKAMQTSEPDVLARLIQLAKLIREFGLYGVPTPDGNQLAIHLRSTGEHRLIHLECPAQQNHRPPAQSTPSGTPSSHLN